MDPKTRLRTQDFRTALLLLAVSLFFLWRTSLLPFFKADAAGVEAGQWYNSAALVPFSIFGALFLLSLGLLWIAIRDGGAVQGFRLHWAGAARVEALRISALAVLLMAYIFCLVPRVDFILSSALVITALTWGFHAGRPKIMAYAAGFVAAPALYAILANPGRDQWAKPWDDDIAVLIAWLGLTAFMFWQAARDGGINRVIKATPFVALLIPLMLTLAMAFGFRQNVPNRSGLVFSQIEYHYYVTLRPMMQGK